jgi:large subunit ribosomal protein L10
VNREKKNQEIEHLKNELKNYKSIFIAGYSRLTVEKFNLLRKELRENGVFIKIFKNTLSRLAIKNTYANDLLEYLDGPNFLLLSNEPSICAKLLSKYAKENADNIKIKAGYYESVLDASKIIILASLPSREVLIGKFIFVVKSPQARLVFALKYPQIKLLQVLSALKLKKSVA